MVEPINLNKYRKAKARAEKEKQADKNRAKFGRTKVEKQTAKTESKKSVKFLDSHKRDKKDKDHD